MLFDNPRNQLRRYTMKKKAIYVFALIMLSALLISCEKTQVRIITPTVQPTTVATERPIENIAATHTPNPAKATPTIPPTPTKLPNLGKRLGMIPLNSHTDSFNGWHVLMDTQFRLIRAINIPNGMDAGNYEVKASVSCEWGEVIDGKAVTKSETAKIDGLYPHIFGQDTIIELPWTETIMNMETWIGLQCSVKNAELYRLPQ